MILGRKAALGSLLLAGLAAGEAKPPRATAIDGHIKRLGSETYAEREAASKALLAIGEAARPRLPTDGRARAGG
jgi:hypothetical protein